MAKNEVTEWVDITDILTDEEIKNYAVEIELALDKFSNVRRVPHGKRGFKTKVRTNFIPQFKSYLSGEDGLSIWDMSRRYGIDIYTIYNAGRKSSLMDGDDPYTGKIKNPRLYMTLTGLEPQEPFSDKRWITGRQLRDMFLGSMAKDSVKIVNMLRKFATKYPDAVAGERVPDFAVVNFNTVEPALNPFDSIRLNRKYLDAFKETFELTPVHERVLMPRRELAKKIKTKEDLQHLLWNFEKLCPGSTGKDILTSELTLQERFFPLFQKYVAAPKYNSDVMLSMQDLRRAYSFANFGHPTIFESKMRKFFKSHPDVVQVDPYTHNIVVHKDSIPEFISFAGLRLRPAPKTVKPLKQEKIDPNAPGYPSDPALKPISDKKMNAVAWRLARQKVKTAAADDMIFAEWAKRKGRKGKL